MNEKDDFLVEVAKLISRQNISIGEFYEALGCDLENHRVEADSQISELAGIFKGWKTASNKGDQVE